MSLWVLIEMLMIPNLMLLLFSEYCRENYELWVLIEMLMIRYWMLLLFSEYC